MKIKYFLPVLAGVALASCTQDDSLLSTNVQNGEYSPITFSVSKEGINDAETRAWEDITGSKPYFNFETGDLLSLWNGMTWNTSAWTSIGQNAVFEGEGAGESLVFKTRSLVNPGTAILVYPADTAFYNSTATELKIKVPAAQNADTKQFLPYVSDVMDIAAYDGVEGTAADNTAGYGRNYDVVLRPVGTLFAMNLNPTNGLDFEALGVAPIKYTEATITNASTNLFPTEVTVTQSNTDSKLKTYDKDLYAHFTKETDITAGTTVASISTKDVADNTTAYFTLLPITGSDAALQNGASVMVSTSYGFVTVENDATAAEGTVGPLQNKAQTNGKNLAENLANVLNNTWAETPNSKFGTENQGRVIRRTLTFDLSTLDMNGLHITDENQLMDVLKVYDAIYADKEEAEKAVIFYLDGDANGEFVMNAEAAAAYEARVADENNKISFKRSQDKDTECTTVKFVSTTETEVPAVIKFEGSGANDKVNVTFAGFWKYSEQKDFKFIKSLTIDEDATMKLAKVVDATLANSKDFVIINNGTVNVEGTTDLKLSMTNNGTINIPVNGEFFVAAQTAATSQLDGVILTNEATSLEEYGKIYNAGNMGVRNNAGKGKINNYGFIQQMNADAYTYVSTNATGDGFGTAFNQSNNKIGTILLFEKGNENTVVGDANKGFIKVITNAASVGTKEIGEYANYVVIEGDCTELTYSSNTAEYYIEVKSNKRVVFRPVDDEGEYMSTPVIVNINGLIIDEGYSINIPSNVTVYTAIATYLKGKVYNAGTFKKDSQNGVTYVGYLGGATTDNANVIYSGN